MESNLITKNKPKNKLEKVFEILKDLYKFLFYFYLSLITYSNSLYQNLFNFN